jgi:hypothetical protein
MVLVQENPENGEVTILKVIHTAEELFDCIASLDSEFAGDDSVYISTEHGNLDMGGCR